MKAPSILLILLTWGSLCYSQTLQIKQLTGDFYVYTTWRNYQGTPFPANGLYLVTKAGVVLIDTPWDSTQFQVLADSISAKHKAKIVMCVSTHSHADRTAGLEFFHQRGASTYTSRLTDQLCVAHHEKRAASVFNRDTIFQVGQYRFEAYYPGPGHTKDNIVVWFPTQKVLYGGCLVKSTEATNLGNISEADIIQWPKTINALKQRFGTPSFIIPGHQGWSDNRSLDHTLDLLNQYENRIKK